MRIQGDTVSEFEDRLDGMSTESFEEIRGEMGTLVCRYLVAREGIPGPYGQRGDLQRRLVNVQDADQTLEHKVTNMESGVSGLKDTRDARRREISSIWKEV